MCLINDQNKISIIITIVKTFTHEKNGVKPFKNEEINESMIVNEWMNETMKKK